MTGSDSEPRGAELALSGRRSAAAQAPRLAALRRQVRQLLAVEARLLASPRAAADAARALLPRMLAEHHRLARLLARAERDSEPPDLRRVERAVRFHRARILNLLHALRPPAPACERAPRMPRDGGYAARTDAWPEQWLG